MEDTHRDIGSWTKSCLLVVLILVLMEDTHRDRERTYLRWYRKGLNPCSNGRYSQSLNSDVANIATNVLILVLMEDTHRVIVRKN